MTHLIRHVNKIFFEYYIEYAIFYNYFLNVLYQFRGILVNSSSAKGYLVVFVILYGQIGGAVVCLLER